MTLEECLNKCLNYEDDYYEDAVDMVSKLPLKIVVHPMWDISDFSAPAVDLWLANNGEIDIKECLIQVIENSEDILMLIPKSDISPNSTTKKELSYE